MREKEDNIPLHTKKMLEGAKLIGAGAATIASAGAAVGIGNVLSSSIHSVARNPSLAKSNMPQLDFTFFTQFFWPLYFIFLLLEVSFSSGME
jgi:F0F1-type ATP synthase membrane subunit c/vacuolar-type H+-ATPase subunit K